MIGTDDDDLDIDLELYCCKFYDKNIHVKHTYFLIIIIIIIIITNFYTGLKNPSVCNTVVLGVLSKIINK